MKNHKLRWLIGMAFIAAMLLVIAPTIQYSDVNPTQFGTNLYRLGIKSGAIVTNVQHVGSFTNGRIAFIGDSTTEASTSGFATNVLQYPDWRGYQATNLAVSGKKTAAMAADVVTITNWVVSGGQGRFIWVLGGYNDVGGGVAASVTQSNLAFIMSATTNVGAVPIIGTCWRNMSGDPYAPYDLIDDWIRTNYMNWGAVLVDLAKVMVYTNLTYDTLHPNALGAKFMALNLVNAVNAHPVPIISTLGTNAAVTLESLTVARNLSDGYIDVGYDRTTPAIRGVIRHGGNGAGINNLGGLQIASQGAANSADGSGPIWFLITSTNTANNHIDSTFLLRIGVLSNYVLFKGGASAIAFEAIRFERAVDGNRYNSLYTTSDDSGNASISILTHDGVTATSQATNLVARGDGSVHLGGSFFGGAKFSVANSATVKGVSEIMRVVSDTSNQTLTALPEIQNTNPRSVHSNVGAGGAVTNTLPAAVVGVSYTFIVRDAQALYIKANGTETIQVGSAVSTATTGNVTASAVGSVIELLCVTTASEPKWVAARTMLTWTVN